MERRSGTPSFWQSPRARALAPVIVALAVLAAVAGAASSVGSGKAALRPGPASVVLTVALTLVGMAALASLLVALRALGSPNRVEMDHDRDPRKRRLERLVAFCIFAALFGIVVLLMRNHRHHFLTLPGAASGAGHHPVTSSAVRFSMPTALSTVAIVIAILALAFGLPALRHRRWARARGRLHPLSVRGQAIPDDEDDSAPLPAAVLTAEVPDPSVEPDARRAIVAAYLQMTDAAARCGVLRNPDETASEYLSRLLSAAGAPAGPASRLTEVFELARYSTEPLGEDSRSVAISCLAEIRLALRPVESVPA